jgi:SAM-dependent methyltransferase
MRQRAHGAGGKWRSSSRRRGPRKESWVERLAEVAARRAPFAACLRPLVHDVLVRALPAEGDVIEIGAGTGGLLELGVGDAPRFLHTDPDADALERLHDRYPNARVQTAHLEQLSAEPASVAGVVGLCVLDLVPELDAALRAIKRVLRPGGALIHLLDMAPAREGLFRAMAAEGGVVLPNLFSDPSATVPPQDLFVADRARIESLLATLKRLDHPLPFVFGRYFERFSSEPFDARATVAEFEALTGTEETSELLRTSLMNAFEVGLAQGLPPPQAKLIASAELLAQRLTRAAERAGLVIEECEVRTGWATALAEQPFTYRSLLLGHERTLSAVPERALCADAPRPEPGQALLEAGLLVFVARA